MAKNKTETIILSKVVFWASSLGAIILLVIGGLAWWGGSFATGMVHDQLAAQKIYFPAAGSKALNPTEYPDLQKYGGQLVDNGEKARAYADGYIGRHLKKIAGGKTYAEVSTASMAAPTDQKLQAQKQSLFQGETLRGILLGNAYAFGTIGAIAKSAAAVMFVASATLAFIAVTKLKYMR